ncbi:MAG: hypothetical protein ACK455_00110 [Bacteroidota bacterium]
MEWTCSRFEINIENKVLKKLKQIKEGLKVRVITTEIGQFVEIANQEEINKEDKTSVIKLVHTIDARQAKTAVLDAGIIIGNEKSKNFVPNSTEPVSYIEKVTTRFHALTGWVLYSECSNEISSTKSKNMDEIICKIIFYILQLICLFIDITL